MEQEKCSVNLGAIKKLAFTIQKFGSTPWEARKNIEILAKKSKKSEKTHPFAKFIRKSKK